MKKTTSILLSIIIAFSSLSVGLTAYAEECEHSYFTEKTVLPTCGSDGYTQQVCKYCNNKQHINIVPSTGEHKYINGVCEVCKAKDEKYNDDSKIESVEIKLYEPTTVNIAQPGSYAYASFTPDEDGYYDLCGIDKTVYGCVITDIKTNKIIADNAFFNNEYNFSAQFKKDTKYLIKIYFYGNGKAGDISFVIKNHSHKFTVTKGTSTCIRESTNSYICSECGYKYTEKNPIDPNIHFMTFENGPVCIWCNKIQTITQVIENEVNVLPTKNKSSYIYYSFVPESDGQYAVLTKCNSSIFLPYILDENFNVLNDKLYQQKKGWGGYPDSFSTGIVYDKFEAGKTYYIGIYCNNKIADDKDSFKVEKHEHNIYLAENVVETCNSEGYKIYKCTTCEYNEKTDIVPATNNHDYVNGKCNNCGTKNPDEIKVATFTPEHSATLTSKYKDEELIFNFTVNEEGYYLINSAVEPSENTIRLSVNDVVLQNNSIRYFNSGDNIKIICHCYTANTQVTLSAKKHEHEYCVYAYTPQSCKANGSITYLCNKCNNKYDETIPFEQGVHYYFNGVCKCGQKDPEYQRINGKLEVDTKTTINEEFANTKFTYEFTASENGFYSFFGIVDDDYYKSTSLRIYDKNNKIIKGVSGGTKSLEIIIEIEKDETVFVEWISGSSGTSTLLAQKHIHKTRDTIIAPSCNELGYTKHVCSDTNCRFIYYDTYTPATGEHIFVETIHKATCVDAGYTEVMCKNCGVGYAYDYVPSGNEYHKINNSICEYCNKLDCDTEILNVKQDEKLELHFSSINDIKILSFTPSKTEMYTINPHIKNINVMLYANDLNTYLGENPVAMTTLLEANVTYFIVLKENTVYTEKSTFDITEHTHIYTTQKVSATCGDYGYVEYYCSVCNSSRFVSYTEPTGKHLWIKDETVAPTCTENGYTAYYCKNC